MKNKKNWIYIAIGIVVLFVVYRYVKQRTWYLDFSDGSVEDKAGAGGGKDCVCTTPWGTHECTVRCKKCLERCRKAVNVQTQ